MTISERLIKSLKAHQRKKSTLEQAHVRIKVSGSELSEDTFAIGFEARSLKDGEDAFELNGLTFVIDVNTQRMLSGATLDIEQQNISITFK